jgi:hypothetical protein
MVLASGTKQGGKVLPQLTAKARGKALIGFLRSVEPGFRREALRFIRTMLKERPEHLQPALDYLVTAYHYYLFTRDSVVPEYERVLANPLKWTERSVTPKAVQRELVQLSTDVKIPA